jgi:hypothetical protein
MMTGTFVRRLKFEYCESELAYSVYVDIPFNYRTLLDIYCEQHKVKLLSTFTWLFWTYGVFSTKVNTHTG